MFLSVYFAEPLFEDRYARDAFVFFCLLVLFNGFILLESRRDLLAFLFPSSIAINYLYLSLFIGALGFYTDNIVSLVMKTDAPSWERNTISNVFLAGVVACVVAFSNYGRTSASLAVPRFESGKVLFILAIYGATLVTFATTGFLFGEQVLAAIFIVFVLHVIGLRSIHARLAMYLVAFIPLALAVAHSKREAIFLLYPVIVVEVIMGKWGKVDLRRLLLATSGVVTVAALIVVMTTLRVPEVFGVKSIFDIPAAVSRYLSFDNFIPYFLLNIEATYTYFHVINTIDLSVKGSMPVLWGETYIKPLFIGIPRDWVDWKPRSAVDYYTTIFMPEFRMAGGSWAISMLGEAFLNFRVMGAIPCAAIICWFDYLFRRHVIGTPRKGLLYSVGALYFCAAVLNFARGSGLDLTLVQFILVVSSVSPVAIFLNYSEALRLVYLREAFSGSGQIIRHVYALPRKMKIGPISV